MTVDEHFHCLWKITVRSSHATSLNSYFEFFCCNYSVLLKFFNNKISNFRVCEKKNMMTRSLAAAQLLTFWMNGFLNVTRNTKHSVRVYKRHYAKNIRR